MAENERSRKVKADPYEELYPQQQHCPPPSMESNKGLSVKNVKTHGSRKSIRKKQESRLDEEEVDQEDLFLEILK